MFSPLAYPDGAIIYDFITHMPPPSHLALTPFDLYREPMVIIALADGKEMEAATFSKRRSAHGTGSTMIEKNARALYQELEDVRDNFQKALVHQVFIFDYGGPPSATNTPTVLEGIYAIPPVDQSSRTTIKTALGDISSHLLAEMTTLAKSFEAMTTIESPTHYSTGNSDGGWDGSDSVNGLSRRNSQHSFPQANGRSASASVADRAQARMSMPPVPSRPTVHHASSTPGRRPSTPVRSGLSNNVDGTQSDAGSDTSTPDQVSSRPDSAQSSRGDFGKKVPVQGFGPGGANDKWRLRGKGRAAVVIGSMYLQAGRWSDSLKELQEGATAARSLNDHIWHGKALELILINLFLLGWSGLEFQVPMVCYPTDDRGKSSKATQHAEIPDQPKHLRNLQVILPDLLDRILNLYSRKRAESEKLPAFPFSEATIRACRIMVSLHLAGGELGKEALDMIVTGRLPAKQLTTSPRPLISPTRQHIVNTLFDAFPSSHAHALELLTTVDRVSILSGIASILGTIGFHRKKAMVVRELVSVLITGLVEGRTRGAADAGVHPAAGLLSMVPGDHRAAGVALDLTEGDIEQGIEAFLELLCRSYGIVGYNISRSSNSSDLEDRDSDEAVAARIAQHDASRFFGFLSIKLNILRACINFSEALPDLNGVLKFSSDLLRVAGSGIAPGPRREDVTPAIYPDEQSRLATNIARNSDLAKRLGVPGAEAEYWDEFLVRGMTLEPLPTKRAPIPHAPSVLPGAVTERASQDVDPFIYNPFLKKPDDVTEQYLVADEVATFRITMQNPYDVEAEIESIRLETTGARFEALPETTKIGPNRTMVMRLKGRAREKGQVNVTGAIVKVRGCRERRFPIYSHRWLPARDAKIKGTGFMTLENRQPPVRGMVPELRPEQLSLNAIQPQPLLSIKSTTLPQSSVMILEGERKVFSITLQNQSPTPVDFMLFSFRDSTQAPLQTALNNRDATPAELHEYELILMKKQALRLPKGNQRRYIDAGGEATFDLEILGKPGLTSATVQIDYTHLGVPREEVSEQFYTRQVSVDLTVTVNAGIEVSRVDALPLHGEIPRALWDRFGFSAPVEDGDYSLLTLDMRNVWPGHIMVQIESDDGMSLDESILPGNTTRVVIPVKRVFLEDPHAAIPSLNPAKERQFVVSSSKISPEMERGNREAFWYREKILQTLRATWRTVSGPQRTGTLDLRNLRLTPRMVDVVKVPEIDIDISVETGDEPATSDEAVAYVDEAMQVKVSVTNRTTKPISPLVRLVPALRNRSSNVALDHTRRIAWNGTLQQLLPQLQGKESADLVIGMTALCRGEFEFTATVEEVELWEDPEEKRQKQQGQQGRQRSDTEAALDAALGMRERRMWHSKRPLVLVVKDVV